MKLKLIHKLLKNTQIYKNIFICFIIILTVYFIYLLRLPITLGGLSLYTKLHKNPHMERFIGEFYLSLAEESNKNAYKYFKFSLENYLKLYDQIEDNKDNHKKTIAYLVGNSYECGKGTKKDLYAARNWYKKAINKSSSQAAIALQRVTKSIKDIEQNSNNSGDNVN